MVEYSIINETNEIIDYLDNIIKTTFKKENITDVIFNVVITDNKKIHDINLQYRNIDAPTDVISFALNDYKDNFDIGIKVLGDIYISLDKAKEQSVEYNHSLKREISFLLVHGLLHLLGYDHMNIKDEEIMMRKTEEILNEEGIYR